MATETGKLTYEDYVLIPADGKRHEIVEGEEYVSPSPRVRHQEIALQLGIALGQYLATHPLGKVWIAPLDVVLSPHDIVQPDLLFIRADRLKEIVTERNIQGAPDLVVEILSEGLRERDEILKRKRYEHFGVAEYWVIDPPLETAKVYRLESGHYRRGAELSRENGDVLTTPLLPEFELSLNRLFAR